jgi:hypothetical protein
VADFIDHIRQAKHNQECATAIMTHMPKFRDWAITATFYAAVHLAEAGFTRVSVQHSDVTKPSNENPHDYRQRMVKDNFGNDCWKRYRKLRIASQTVRYLADWQSNPGKEGMDYYSEAGAEKFLKEDLPYLTVEIGKITGTNLS